MEIDESKIYRRKNHQGRVIHHRYGWVFGMVERANSNNVVLRQVNDRTAATLLPIIQQWILPGSIVMSDMWQAYPRIAQLPQGYTHLAANHRVSYLHILSNAVCKYTLPIYQFLQLHFIRPPGPGVPVNLPVHTQTIESTWSDFKRRLKHLRGTSEGLWKSYLYQYMFLKAHNGDNIFGHLMSEIARQYPV